MLNFNQKLYAKNQDEAKNAQSLGKSINGFYAPVNGGYKLFDLGNELQAYISRRSDAKMVVDAYVYPGDGRVRYMYSTSSKTEEWLGYPEDMPTSMEARLIDGLKEYEPGQWVIYSPGEYSASDDGAGFWSNEDGWTTLPGAGRYDEPLPSDQMPVGSQMLEIGSMQDYRLMVVENPHDQSLDQTPILFQCFSEDLGHAIEQAVDAYPGCRVMGLEGSAEPLTFKASWIHRTLQGQIVRTSVDGVAWWRDETSLHDDFTLRMMYAPDGRKMAGAIVEDDGEVSGWDYSPAVGTAEDEEPIFSPG